MIQNCYIKTDQKFTVCLTYDEIYFIFPGNFKKHSYGFKS